jgi:hypothetical protein
MNKPEGKKQLFAVTYAECLSGQHAGLPRGQSKEGFVVDVPRVGGIRCKYLKTRCVEMKMSTTDR